MQERIMTQAKILCRNFPMNQPLNNINDYVVLNCVKEDMSVEFILKQEFVNGVVSSARHQYHFHPTYEIHIPVDAVEHIMVHDKDIYVQPGEICIIPPNMGHFVFPSENIDNFRTGFRFTFSRVGDNKSKVFTLFERTFGVINDMPAVIKSSVYRKYISVMIENFSTSLPTDINVELLFLSLYETAFNLMDGIEAIESPNKSSDILMTDKIEEYLNLHYSEKILLEELAEYLNFSKRQTERIITRLFGMTFCELVNKKRLLVSKLLLKTTDLPINQISQRVGFDDHHYFYRKFTTAFSTTPGAYRREHKSEKF